MPYMTRDMATFAKDKGISSSTTDERSDNNKKKLRETPSSTDGLSSVLSAKSKKSKSSTPKSRKTPTSKSSSGSSKKKSSAGKSSAVSSVISSSRKGNSKKGSGGGGGGGGGKSKVMSGRKSGEKKSSKKKPSSKGSGRSGGKSSKRTVSATKTEFSQYENPAEKLSFDEKSLRYTIALLRSNITKLKTMEGAIPLDKEFTFYQIDYKKKLIPPKNLKHCDDVVMAQHRNKEFKDFPLCCKIYDQKKRKIDPNCEYFRILRTIGRKHPCIIQTWGIYLDDANKRILMLQEWCAQMSLDKIVAKHDGLQEKRAAEMAAQMVKAMDYLGDTGLAHRAISPRNVFVSCREPLRAKLAGLRQARIYWDIKKEDVILVPCLPLSKKSKEPEFQAPEVYGDESKEQFDPINADIWSYGATIYFGLSKKYPYDFCKENPNIEKEIQDNVNNLKASKKCRQFLGKILQPNAKKRMRFDKIDRHPWLLNK